jgi:hypothetical protein
MSGPWNRNSDFKARRIDIKNESEFDEKINPFLDRTK